MNENQINVACDMHWQMSSAFKTLGYKTEWKKIHLQNIGWVGG